MATYHINYVTSGSPYVVKQGKTKVNYRVVGDPVYPQGTMELQLMYTSDENNRIIKTFSNTQTLHGALRDGTSIVDPIITVSSPTPILYNYAYIPAFGRYYFITDVVSITRNFWEIHMHVDVLHTYRSPISAVSARVLRAEKKADFTLNDTLMPTSADISKRRIAATNAPSDWVMMAEGGINPTVGLGHLMVKLACHQIMVGTEATRYRPTTGYFWMTMSFATLDSIYRQIRAAAPVTDAFRIEDYILDVHWTPAPATGYTYDGTVIVQLVEGATTIVEITTGVGVFLNIYKLKSETRFNYNLPAAEYVNVDGVSRRVTYHECPPYRAIAVDYPAFGTIPLDSAIWAGRDTLTLRIEVDAMTGNANMFTEIAGSGGALIYNQLIGSCNIAYPLALVNTGSTDKAMTAAIVNGISGIANAGVYTALSGNALPVIGAAVNLVTSSIQASMSPPALSSCASTGSGDALQWRYPTIVVTTRTQNMPTPSIHGYAYNTYTQLTQIKGFFVCGEAHIEGNGFRQATKGEKDEILRLLQTGVIGPNTTPWS